MTDTERYLRTMFQPDEVVEIRAKSELEPGLGWRGWFKWEDGFNKLLTSIIPTNEMHQRNIWVGVCPRVAEGSGVPLHVSKLWADIDNVSPEAALQSLEGLPIPAPCMVVDSGHGTHLYWFLDREYGVDEVRPYTRWLSHNIPGADGATHDVTRVLRLPGTTNFKAPRAMSSIVDLRVGEGASFPLSVFPKLESSMTSTGSERTTVVAKLPLATKDRMAFTDAWEEGQRHQVALAVSGYLRKGLGWSESEVTDLLREIHFLKGGEPGDANDLDLRHCVASTFAKPPQLVRGFEGLRDLGVELTESVTLPTLSRPKPQPAPRMKLINFSQELKAQEFWVDGFIGPGLLTMIAAEPKVGKSMVAMQIAHAISNGQRVFDFGTDGCRHPVLYFQGELSQGMVYDRARSMFPPGTFEDARMFGMTDKPDKILNLTSDPEPLMDLAEHYDCVIIDPLSVFNANDENGVTSVRETLAVFDTLKAMGKAVVLVHHTRKLEANRQGQTVTPSISDIRGSGAWFAAVDAVAMLYNKGEEGNAEMKFVFRAAPERRPLPLYRMPHGGFTSDRDTYLRIASQRGMTVDLRSGVVN